MPYQIVCSKCRYQLALVDDIPLNPHLKRDPVKCFIQLLTETRLKYNGKCPQCRKPLAHKPISIDVVPLEICVSERVRE